MRAPNSFWNVPLGQVSVQCQVRWPMPGHFRSLIDSFTVSLHSHNCRHFPADRLCKGAVSGLWNVNPQIHCDWGNPNLYLDKPSIKGWYQPIRGHASYPTESHDVTTLRLCSSLCKPNNCLIIWSHEVSKLQNFGLESSKLSVIWKASLQHSCPSTCKIYEWYHHLSPNLAVLRFGRILQVKCLTA